MSDERARRVYRQLQALGRAQHGRRHRERPAQVAEVVGEIVRTALDVDDGLIYDTTSMRTEVMRAEAEYPTGTHLDRASIGREHKQPLAAKS